MGHGVTWPVDDRLISPYSWMFGLFHQLRSPVTKLAVLLLGAFIDKNHQYVPIISLSTTIFLASQKCPAKKSPTQWTLRSHVHFFLCSLTSVSLSVFTKNNWASDSHLPRDIGVGPICIRVDHLLERLSWRKFGEAMGTGKGYEEVMGFNGIS